ncbi:MAG TPA: hypothetical protein VMH23_12200 [Bacteroidota bacterium]|nr:hypothetical protein [Bacteroidota bacterium]
MYRRNYYPLKIAPASEEVSTRTVFTTLLGLVLLSGSALAQTADELIAHYVKAIGGAEKIGAIRTLRRTGKYIGGGGFEAPIVEENKRPNMVRQDFTIQGLTGITAYDGTVGWKVQPWDGKKDAESLEDEEMKAIIEDSDFDGPLVNYKQKGNKVEYLGLDPVDGTDAYKLKVTLPSGDTRIYYMDTDYYVPIKIEIKRIVRGEEHEYERTLGEYKEVAGCYLPFSVETNVKGNPNGSKVAYERIEANVPIDDKRFAKPTSAPKAQ